MMFIAIIINVVITVIIVAIIAVFIHCFCDVVNYCDVMIVTALSKQCEFIALLILLFLTIILNVANLT